MWLYPQEYSSSFRLKTLKLGSDVLNQNVVKETMISQKSLFVMSSHCSVNEELLDPTTEPFWKDFRKQVKKNVCESLTDLDVNCMEDSIHIALNLSSEIALNGHDLRIGNSNCTLYSNGSHLLANMSLSGCSMEMEVRLYNLRPS